MEYLTRTLRVVGDKTQFTFHLRCAGVNLNHLYFADDVILYSRADFVSIYYMLQGFKHFSSDASGLEVNDCKSQVYTSGMTTEEVQRIIDASGFKLGKLPFKYLGFPICFKGLPLGDA